jgi:hypothetical protein
LTSARTDRKKLAIVGAGSAGLISLYYAVRRLSDWEIACFEKSGDTTGAWGFPYSGFVSTSTKYTTQYACHRKFDATAHPEGERLRADFYRDGEFGDYLQSFVRDQELAPYIRHHCDVRHVERIATQWRLTLDGSSVSEEDFDALILCTGLAERPKEIPCDVEQLLAIDAARPVTGKKVVVVGGGESAVDIADRLAEASLGNQVFLSIKTGIRVSPRYHPIKGVPSDFLRTRLLLSIHEDIRNAVGQKFVEARIQHQELFERVFRRKKSGAEASSVRDRRKYWAAKLTERAKDSLFNMFHNKSDDFLDAIAENRLRVVGPPLDETYRTYADFEDGHAVDVDPDLLVPRIGFSSDIRALSNGTVEPSDFYLGCVHAEHDNLFLVGFARPIIGNIPGINEIQAQYVTGLLAGRAPRPAGLREAHRRERARLRETFPKLDTDLTYPVEMFPYCDRLARRMGTYPSLRSAGSLRSWLKIWLSPASTLQYVDESYDAAFMARQPIHAPVIITALLLLIKLIDIPYSLLARRADRRSTTPAR